MKKIKINNFDQYLHYEKLPNGLEVFVIPYKKKRTFSAMLGVKYGGKDIKFKIDGKEKNTPTGIAHFLEHKMFEKEVSPFDFYNKFGSDVNASTSYNYTNYYFTGTKGFNQSLKYLLNWISSLEIDDKMVKKEQGIILEEANMYKDNPNRVIYKKINNNIYVKDSKMYEVIGTDKDIVSITKKDLELCYNSFYKPNNMFLIVAGNIDPKKVINIAKEETKKLKNSTKKIEKTVYKEPDKVKKHTETIKMNVMVPKVAAAYKISKKLFKDLNITNYEIEMYLTFLYNIAIGPTSIIRNKWLKEKLFTDSYFVISNSDNHLIVEFYATSNLPDKLVKNLKNYLKDLNIDKDSFERHKKMTIAYEIRKSDDLISMSYDVMSDILDYDHYINNKVEIIKNMTFEILEKIKKLCNYQNEVIIKILPKK